MATAIDTQYLDAGTDSAASARASLYNWAVAAGQYTNTGEASSVVKTNASGDIHAAGDLIAGTTTVPTRAGVYIYNATVPTLHMTNSSTGELVSNGSYMNVTGTGALNIGNQESGEIINIFCDNDGNKSLRIDGGKLSTGGESSPDVDAGGLCLNQGASDGEILTLKSSDIAHGVTDLFDTDTYFGIAKQSATEGGILATGLTESSTGYGVVLRSVSADLDTTTSAAGVCGVLAYCRVKTGTTTEGAGADDNLFGVSDGTGARFIVKGDGDIYYDGADQGAYDAEDDIMLVEAMRGSMANWDSETIKQYKPKLEELGIMKNGFISNRKSLALNLGAVGQLWNTIKAMGKMLGLDDQQLLELSKQY